MSESLHIQIALQESPERIFRALTEELPAWFAEYADVSPAEKRYDFWGRYTPGTPDREGGRHPLLDYQAGSRLRYSWRLGELDTAVNIGIHTQDGKQYVVIHHEGVTRSHDIDSFATEDIWFLALENLRRYLDGKAPVRCDFSMSMMGDIEHSVEIDTSREAVFEALINPKQLERWIASNATVEARVGGDYNLGWDYDAGALKILEIVPNEKLSLSWPEGDGETVVTWTLAGSGGKTRLTLVHSGFAPDKPTHGLKTGWLNFMSWVKSLTEYGADWKPAVIRISPELGSFYPISISEGQSTIVSS
jgi:uncharacterized protein YndB with AHSA1/START domain